MTLPPNGFLALFVKDKVTKDPCFFFELGGHIFCQTCVNPHHPCSSTNAGNLAQDVCVNSLA